MNLPATSSSDKLFRLDSYAYDLPEELIAQHPCTDRAEAKLMVLNRATGTIHHDTFAHIGKYLPPTTQFVLNNTKVIHARLIGRRATGGEVEVFLLNDKGNGQDFEALLKPLKRIKEGESILFDHGIKAELIDKSNRIVRFDRPHMLKVLEDVGHIPLPPYIKRSDIPRDREDYQTVYAKQLGSVAAPTAGLHFTQRLIDDLGAQGHTFKELTLHINYGTFKPVETADIRQHPMHSEYYTLAPTVAKAIAEARGKGSPIVSVGTTACRVLESAATTGRLEGDTNIFIYPGYTFKAIDMLVTNFHLPHSTLLMLVSAFGGYDLVMRAYTEAIKHKYRFYSYGDAMLII